MEGVTLREYLKHLKAQGNGGVERLASAAMTTPAYLERLASGTQRPGPGLARRIEAATQGVVRKEVLRPDIWGNN